jgi:hypothetical protein
MTFDDDIQLEVIEDVDFGIFKVRYFKIHEEEKEG